MRLHTKPHPQAHTHTHTHPMSGFGKYTHNYSTRLKDTPWYRKGAKGPDPLALFTAEANRNYARNTDQLRDMRFARSNEMSRDSAVRSRRDSKMSQMSYANARDPRELAGLHARVVARGTRAMGAESDGKTYLSVRKRWGGLGRGAGRQSSFGNNNSRPPLSNLRSDRRNTPPTGNQRPGNIRHDKRPNVGTCHVRIEREIGGRKMITGCTCDNKTGKDSGGAANSLLTYENRTCHSAR